MKKILLLIVLFLTISCLSTSVVNITMDGKMVYFSSNKPEWINKEGIIKETKDFKLICYKDSGDTVEEAILKIQERIKEKGYIYNVIVLYNKKYTVYMLFIELKGRLI